MFPDTLRINGAVHRINRLLQGETHRAEADTPETAPGLITFLNQWYGPKESITVRTSGSTGPPQPLVLRKRFVAQSALRTLAYFELAPGARILLCLPLRYIAGKLMVVRALLGGLDLCTADPATDFAFLSRCRDTPFQFAAMVPNQVAKLSGHPERFSALGTLLIGGSGVPATLEAKLQAVPTACFASYGMTETATHIALRRINGPEASTWFRCLAGIAVGCAPNGCLTIDMPGLGSAGPLVTNDLATCMDTTRFRILGRADHVIISGGIKYFPEMIEKKLESLIEYPFFIGAVPDETLGHCMVLVIEAVPDTHVENSVAQLLEQHLDRYERPRKILFKTPFMRTETGKIIRVF